MYAFEALNCLLATFNCKIFGKTLFFLQDVRKSKSNIVFLCFKSNFSSVLTSWTKSRPYLFIKTSVNKLEAANLIRATQEH